MAELQRGNDARLAAMDRRPMKPLDDELTAKDLFAVFEHLLQSARLRLAQEAKPVVFELAPSGETWLFDPRASGALFAKSDALAASGVLHLRCHPELLARLVAEDDFELDPDDELSVRGNIEDLLPMANALAESSSVLGVRISNHGRR